MSLFIHAKDSSILTSSIKTTGDVSKNYNPKNIFQNEASSIAEEEEENLEVFLRIKKIDTDFSHLYEISGNVLSCKLPAGTHSARNVRDNDNVTKKYTFSNIFGEDASQEQIFNNIVKPRILEFINGGNCTLLMYGASGSGKTFTMVGNDKQPGIIPRSLEYLFRTVPDLVNEPLIKPEATGKVKLLNKMEIQEELLLRQKILNATLTDYNVHIKTYRKMQKRLSNAPVAELSEVGNLSVAIWVSFAEIYNEQVYDLLQLEQPKNKPRQKLKLIKNTKGQVFVKDLTLVNVSSGVEAYQILQYGLNYLQYASTAVNAHSSRSHCIFTIKLAQYMHDKKTSNISYFNFCDLAGAERLKKTLNKGDRLKESNNINNSLLVLHRCITCIRNGQKSDQLKMAPFRDSKLTTLFQQALSGYESICMIVTLNPILKMYDESQHVLNFSAIAKDIIVQPLLDLKTENKNRFSDYVQARSTIMPNNSITNKEREELQNQIEKLYYELEQQKIESEENEMAVRKKIVQDYEELLNRNEAMWKRRTKALEEKHAKELKLLKDRYESMFEETELDNEDSVINLDSDSEEEKADLIDLQEELDAITTKNTELQKTLSDFELQNKELKVKLLESEDLIQLQSEENRQLKAQIYKLEEQQSLTNNYIDVKEKTIMDFQEEIENLENSFVQQGHDPNECNENLSKVCETCKWFLKDGQHFEVIEEDS